jgi:DNA-binding MarR family transcriptional regulator
VASAKAAARGGGDDFWPLFIEFMLGHRTWWVALCSEWNLTPMQGHALRMLDPDRPVAMSTLADSLCCDASNVTGIVDKLESRGLIARQGATEDRRVKMLAVTSEGRRLRGKLWERTMDPPAPVKKLGADARRRLADIMRAILRDRASASGEM